MSNTKETSQAKGNCANDALSEGKLHYSMIFEYSTRSVKQCNWRILNKNQTNVRISLRKLTSVVGALNRRLAWLHGHAPRQRGTTQVTTRNFWCPHVDRAMIPHGENAGKGCNNGQRFDLHFRDNDGNGALNRHGNKKDAMQRTYNALRFTHDKWSTILLDTSPIKPCFLGSIPVF
ncbi:hypothetical protein ARMGADRAFT_1031906 [Armillaria gallica]|uniref:Uncharacterized protein n=1 Tax=Armillaria gallica TaxID=47427 RepID=A0A2H3DID1_ARMGA|nr:hypothetical protein ARMGADRAFT_1031906 [Armillaria gallica]